MAYVTNQKPNLSGYSTIKFTCDYEPMKTILFSMLLLFSINGFAFNWEKVGDSTDGSSFYIDVDSIKTHNGMVYYLVLFDRLKPFMGDYSNINKYNVNCEEEKRTWLSFITYSQSKGEGEITTEGNPNIIQYPKSKSIDYVIMKFACNF